MIWKTLFEMAMGLFGRVPLSLGFLAVFFVCPVFAGERYFPLDPGNRWVYVMEGATSDEGLEISVLEREGSRVFLSFWNTEVILEDRGSEIDIELEGIGFVPYYRFDEDSWVHRDLFSCDDNRLLQITDRQAVVETPAGTFSDCLQVEYQGDSLCSDAGTFVEWWAPEVGRVKWTEDTFIGAITRVLKSYTGGLQVNFRRGDVDMNGELDLTDVVKFLNFQFVGTGFLDCLDAADIDDDGELTLTDAIRSLNYQFSGTASAPEPPGPFECGPDGNEDALPPCEYPAQVCE